MIPPWPYCAVGGWVGGLVGFRFGRLEVLAAFTNAVSTVCHLAYTPSVLFSWSLWLDCVVGGFRVLEYPLTSHQLPPSFFFFFFFDTSNIYFFNFLLWLGFLLIFFYFFFCWGRFWVGLEQLFLLFLSFSLFVEALHAFMEEGSDHRSEGEGEGRHHIHIWSLRRAL